MKRQLRRKRSDLKRPKKASGRKQSRKKAPARKRSKKSASRKKSSGRRASRKKASGRRASRKKAPRKKASRKKASGRRASRNKASGRKQSPARKRSTASRKSSRKQSPARKRCKKTARKRSTASRKQSRKQSTARKRCKKTARKRSTASRKTSPVKNPKQSPINNPNKHILEIVEHDDNSALITQYITEGVWNSVGYTQVEKHPNTTQKRQDSITNGQWATDLGYDNSVSLFDLANFPVKPVKDKEILMFHGSNSDMISSFSSGIDWTKGGEGADLGHGFYLTFNPNTAKKYAKNSCVDHGIQTRPIILEIVIKNSDVFKHRTSSTNSRLGSWSIPSQGGDFIRDHTSRFDEIAVRDEIISNMEIKRIHVFNSIIWEKCFPIWPAPPIKINWNLPKYSNATASTNSSKIKSNK